MTPLSFRRDVRLFLALLVGFLVLLVATVVLLLQAFEADAEDAVRTNWQRAAEFAAAEISAAPNDASALETTLSVLCAKYDIASAQLTRPNGRRISTTSREGIAATETLRRTTSAGELLLTFDAGPLQANHRTFLLTAIVSLTAAAIGSFLLILFIPTITRPIEAMLNSAGEVRVRDAHVDEREYLIDTFRESIEKLKTQESELQRLHSLEKTRADDLERVTAALTRSITSGFVGLDPAGRVVDVNTAAREILQPSGESLWGLTPEEAFGTNAFSSALAESVSEKTAISRLEVTIVAGGAAKTIGLTTVPLVGEQLQFLGTLALFTDLTPMRMLEERLRAIQSLADLGEISAGIAHEFRNSLATVLGYLRLARRATLPPEAAAAVGSAERESTLLSNAVDGLLAFAKPIHLDVQRFDLLDLAREVTERLAPQTGAVDVTVSGEHVEVDGDPALLARAVENLVRNAIDSVRQHGSGAVRVSTEAAPEPLVRIEDDGAGIDPAAVPRLMLPFQSDRPGGYGLGLPLARKIVLLHGGRLQLTGSPGGGATAVITLPAAQ
ncbi:MAG TPA: ATP-binding protein [Thermoanaerobaculia bacterium]|nr:ATP-binding protein [Thermoanaerobaculia bacterium]